jgi:zinc protease
MNTDVYPFSIDTRDLPNGLRVITAPMPVSGVVSLFIVVRAGSRNEIEQGRSGFAHFFEHMMFRGTPAYPPERYEALLQQTGASSNAFTDDDRTVYHTTLAAEDLPLIMQVEADRFRSLSYPEEAFRTEALAVLGEYNKDSAEPLNKLHEVLRDTAFDVHTYKHTTMGFLRDIVRMPEMYDYSRLFFDRFYRPEYTLLIVAGDTDPGNVSELAERFWGGWKRGAYDPRVPAEPAPLAPRAARLPWKTQTLPYLAIAHRAPAFSTLDKDSAALDLISHLGFSETSPLYEKLVLNDQVVDLLWASCPDHVDPYLFTVTARIKEPAAKRQVHEAILETLAAFTARPVDEARFNAVRSHLRSQFALSLDDCEFAASMLAHYAGLTGDPLSLNARYQLYDSLTPDDLTAAACRVFRESARTTLTLEPEAA